MEQIRASELRISDVIEVHARHTKSVLRISVIPFTADIEVDYCENFTCDPCHDEAEGGDEYDDITCQCFEDHGTERYHPDEILEIVYRED